MKRAVHRFKVWIQASKRLLARSWRRVVTWWRKYDRRYGIWWRLANLVVAGVILLAALIPTIEIIRYQLYYRLDDTTLKLVGTTDSTLTSKLSFNSQTRSYEFNKSAIKSSSATPYAALQAQIGTGSESLYALDVHEDGGKGVTYHDINSRLEFSLVPQFTMSAGKSVDGHLVYPLSGGNKLVYTLKNNGLKEDIVVPKVASDTMAFSYSLQLPKTLEARMLPDGSGGIGVYSASPELFADASYSTDADKQAVQKARESSEKTYLVFGLPAPVILDTAGKKVGKAVFKLDGTTLSVVASNLGDITTPIAIDPSVVVTSTSDFQENGNDGGNISFDTAGQVERRLTTGGTTTWTSTTSLPTGSEGLATASYNSYIYAIGGTGLASSVYYAATNSDGTLGSWTATSSMNTPRSYMGAAAYNSRLYVWGGYNNSSGNATASVEYAPINSDGSLGSWTLANSMPTAVCRAGTAAFKGYLYSFGGSTTPSSGCTSSSTGATSTVQYAAIKADGSLGNWQTTTSIAYGSSGQVISAMATIANGYAYLAGGHNNGGGTSYSDMQSAPVNADGSLGSWTATTSLTAATHSAGFISYQGFLFMLSNQSNATSSAYAQVYSGGTTASWFSASYFPLTSGRSNGSAVSVNNYLYYIGGSGPSATAEYTRVGGVNSTLSIRGNSVVGTSFTTARERAGAAAYGSCIYLAGGYGGGSNNYVNYAQYSSINSDGNITNSWPNKSFSGLGRADLAVVAYNGYLYSIGGYNANSPVYFNTVQYASIANDCSLGTWTNTTAFDSSGNARGGISAFVYNGYLYVAGGINAGGNFSSVRYAPLNSDGSVGTWNSTTSLPTAMNRQRTVVWGNKVYLLGGTTLALPNPNNGASTGSRPTGSGRSNTYYATINDDGTLGSWTSTTAMPYDIYEFGAGIIDGYIMIAGGFGSGGVSSYWYTAPLNSDGSIGTWTVAFDRGGSFSIASTDMVVANGYVYLVAGRTDTGLTNPNRSSGVVRANVINAGPGEIGTMAAGNTLVTGRIGAGSSASGGYVYVVGGSSDGGSTGRTDIEYSKAGLNGTLGTFTTDSHTLSSGRMFPGVVAYLGHLYVVGGKTSSSYYGNVQYSDLTSSGGLGSNFTTSASFVTGSGSDTGRAGVCAVAYKNRLYAIGGWDGTNYYNTTRYTSINSETGALGSWSDSGNTFTSGRYGASCFAANGYMYIIGGRNGSTSFNDVQVAPINSDGTLGNWKKTASFSGARSHFVSGYNNGFVYIYGGCTTAACTAGYADTQFAQLGLDGMLGPWQLRPSTATGYSPYLTTGTLYNSYLYQFGGSDAVAATNTTVYAPTLVIPRVGYYSKFLDLGAVSRITGITYNGRLENSYSPGLSPITFRSATGSGQFFPSTFSTAITAGTVPCDTSNPAYTRYLQVEVRLDNITSGAFADSSSFQSYISDLTVNYVPVHPSTDVRLRGGKSLVEGNLTAHDTCYP